MKISVIIPAYNIKDCLSHSIDSVLRQRTDSEIEVVIVDDGSTDGTAQECDNYSNIPNVKIVHKQNGGLSSARNAGIEASSGDWLMFLDGDDYLATGALAHLSQLIEQLEKPVDFIQFRYCEVYDYQHISIKCPVSYEIIADKYEIFRRKIALGGIGASTCTKLINRQLLADLRFKEGILHEDEQFTARLIDNIKVGVLYTDAELYHYVMRQGSIIKSRFTKKKLDIISVLEEQIAILKRNGFEDLAAIVSSRLFMGLCLLYVSSREVCDKDASCYIKEIATQFSKRPNIKFRGKFGIISKALKLHLPALESYYIFKRLRYGQNKEYVHKIAESY